jgi:hypothetical protein
MASAGMASAATATPSKASPAQLLSMALASADHEGSVHWVSVAKVGAAKLVITTDAGRSTGYQTNVVSEQGQEATVTERLVGTTAYVRGNALGLEVELNFTATAAADEAGKWLSVSKGGPDYELIAAGLTVSTTMAELEIAGTVKSAPSVTINGQRTLGLRGATKPIGGAPSVDETLYVTATGTVLPVRAVQTHQGTVNTVNFTNWGETVPRVKPPASTPIKASWL